MVPAPMPEQENARRPERGAERMKKKKTSHLNRISGLPAQPGIWDLKLLRRDWRAKIERLQAAEGGPLPPEAEITREGERLRHLRDQLRQLARNDRVRRRKVRRSAEGKQPEKTTALGQRAELIAHFEALDRVDEVGASILTPTRCSSGTSSPELGGYVGMTLQPNGRGPR